MSNHTGTMGACQDYAHDPRPESTPSHSHPHSSSDSIDRRLAQRYGAWLLTGGYTAIPTYAWVYYARLGVTEAEMVLVAQLCTYWWSARDPFPGEAALAARMGKSVRTIQGYLRSLEGKGLLHIHTRLSTNGRQSTNAYNLRPFFTAVEGLARLDGLLADDDNSLHTGTPTPRDTSLRDGHRPPAPRDTVVRAQGSDDQHTPSRQDAERQPLCADVESGGPDNRPPSDGVTASGEGERSRAGGVKNPSPQVNPIEIDSFDLDSIPPTPVNRQVGPTASNDPNDQALVQEVTALSVELGDNAPASSVTRARNLCRDAGVSPERFLRLLDEAAARTRARQASILKRRHDGATPNGMPYLFAVLQDLLHLASARIRMAGVGPDRHRGERPGRRRRRADGDGASVSSYTAWSDSPVPLPIVEEHPVWRAVLAELAQVMTSENFNAWLASTRALDQEGELLHVTVPNQFNKEWLERKLCGKVMGALQKIDYDALGASRVGHVAYVVEVAV